MSKMSSRLGVCLFVLLLGMVASAPVFAGSAVVGSVAGSMNATVGGQTLLPNSTLFSGDSLQVKDGVAVVAVGNASRMVFGRETAASFLRESNEVTVLLASGNVSIYHPDDTVTLRVKVGEISVVPAAGFKTLGEVAMLNGVVVVTAKEGMLRIEEKGSVVNVAKGRTITVMPTVQQKAAGAAAGGAKISGTTALQVVSVGAGATSAVMSGVAISRAGDAKTAATTASSTAASAVTAANAAASAADSAATAAEAAQTALTTLQTTLCGLSVSNPDYAAFCTE
jgi:hypothetical protein